MSSIRNILCTALSLGLIASPAFSQIEFKAAPERPLKKILTEDELTGLETDVSDLELAANMFLFLFDVLRPDMTVDTGLKQVLARAKKSELDGVPGISMEDFKLSYRMQMALRRGQFVARLLGYDLNSDGQVSSDEAMVFARKDTPVSLQQNGIEITLTLVQINEFARIKKNRIMAADSDSDGVISLAEMLKRFHTEGRRPSWPLEFARPAQNLMSFDADGDGITTDQEIEVVYNLALLRVDQNQNGRFEVEEMGAMRRTIDRDFSRDSGKELQKEIEALVKAEHR